MNEHLIAWLFASILLILLAASGITYALIARRGTTPTLLPSFAGLTNIGNPSCRSTASKSLSSRNTA